MIPWAAPTWQGSSQSADLLRRQRNIALEERNGKILSMALQSQFWKKMEEKNLWEREGAALGHGTGAAPPSSAAGDPSEAHLQPGNPANSSGCLRTRSLESIVFENEFPVHSNCWLLLPKNWACQPLPPSPFPGELVGREIILYKAT